MLSTVGREGGIHRTRREEESEGGSGREGGMKGGKREGGRKGERKAGMERGREG